MFGFLWDLHQQNRLRELDHDSRRATREAQSGLQMAEELQTRLDRLELLCAAMGSLLQERTGITSAQIEERIRELDLQDGQIDGRMHKKTTLCPKCGRVMSQSRGWCAFCGL